MTSWRVKKTLEDDFNEEKYFNDEENEPVVENKKVEDDEVDELDLYMQGIEQQAQTDKQNMGKDLKRKAQERMIEEDPMEQYMDSVKKKLITQANKNNPNKIDEDNEDEQNYDFLDSDGEVDFDAVKKMKKQNFTLLDKVDHKDLQYEKFEKNFYNEHPDIKAMTDEQLKSYMEKEQLKVKGLHPPKPIVSFGHLNFDETLMNQIAKQNFVKPTPIQAQALPCILQGRDVVGVAKTGSGKTLAYIWPMLIHISDQRPIDKNEGPIAVILCPTRELTQQVYIETKRYARLYDITVTALLGGENKKDQWKSLKAGVDIIVATPGRLMEMVQKKATNMKRCTYAVIDEADKMFSMGFEKQIRSILQNIRPDRQTLLFTATLKKSIQNLIMDVLQDPITINHGVKNQANEDVKQEVVVLRNNEDKLKWVVEYLITLMARGKVIIFVNQIKDCENLAQQIKLLTGYQHVLTLHGDKLQQERTQIINEFKGDKMLMVATDVAARGLDVPQIRTVVNFDNPKDADTHIHRVGRTGRAGDRMGTAYSLITDMEVNFAVTLMKNFEISGQTVTPELEMVAMKDSKFKLKKMTTKMGVNFAKGKDAQKLLKSALNRQKQGRGGLGFQESKSEDYEKKKLQQEVNRRIEDFKKQQEIQQKQAQLEQQLQQQEQGLQQEMKQQFVSYNLQNQEVQVKDNQIVPKRGFSKTIDDSLQQKQQSVMSEREKIRQEYQQRLKATQQSSFRSTFQSAGTIKSEKVVPTITFAKKRN